VHKKKIFLLTVFTILSLLVFTACNNKDIDTDVLDESAKAPETEKVEDTIQGEANREVLDGKSDITNNDENSDEQLKDEEVQEKIEAEEKPSIDTDNNSNSSIDIEIENTDDEATSTNNIVQTPTDEEMEVEEIEEGLSLEISGSGVENALKLSLDELKAMEDYYFEDQFFSLNSFGTTEYFSFKGVRIKGILEKAKVKENAKTVSFVASDGYEIQLSLEDVLREDYIDEQDSSKKYPIIIAWHENGKDYDIEKGMPFRLVIGQKEAGDVNKPQWVQNIAKIIVD